MSSTVAEKTLLKFKGDAKDLNTAISIAATIAPAKSTRPVLQNLLLDGHDGILEVTATDMEITVRVRIERVEIESDGKVLVNAGRFQQILRELAGEQVEVSTDDRAGCVITTSDGRWQVMGEQAEDFPELAGWPDAGMFQLKAGQLVEMVRRTHFAAHPEKTRYAMNGILMDLKEKRIHLVATDGKRLSMCDRVFEHEVDKPMHVVVPTKAMTLLQRMLESGEESVEVAVDSSQIHLRTSRALLSARLIQGHFPPYEEVLPKDHDKQLKLPREAFICALRRASLLGTKDSQAVRFTFGREGIELTARVPEVGESRVRFPMDFPFDELEIGFNPQYFLDVLKVLESTEFLLELKDDKSAAVIRETTEEQTFVYLVMPLNLGS